MRRTRASKTPLQAAGAHKWGHTGLSWEEWRENWDTGPVLIPSFTNNKRRFGAWFHARCCGDAQVDCSGGIQPGEKTRELHAKHSDEAEGHREILT